MEPGQDHEVRDNTAVLDAIARLRAGSSATGEDVLACLDDARRARSSDPQHPPETPPHHP
jgi:hypothetical protein